MIGHLSRRERTIIAAGLAVSVVIGGWLFVVAPILKANRVATDTGPAREQVLQRRQELIARKAAIASELETATSQVDALSARLLSSATPAVAASELQKIVKDLAAQAKTEVRSERILPTAERGELIEIPVEIAVSGEIRQLVDLLAKLDEAPKLLTVQDLRIRVVNISQPRELLATLTLSGFVLPAKAKS
jgi:Tfp pilus assembly protein PilO